MVSLVCQEKLENQVKMEMLDLKDLLEDQENVVFLECLVYLDLKAIEDFLDLMVQKETLDLLEKKEKMDPLDLWVL